MHWYYLDNAQRVGPLSEAEFQRLVSAGQIRADTLVWKPGLAEWTAYDRLTPQAPPSTAPPPTSGNAAAGTGALLDTCSQCSRVFPRDELMVYENRAVCFLCKPLFLQRLKEGALLPGTVVYAGFWVRFVALMIDSLIMGAAGFLILLPFGVFVNLSMSPSNPSGLPTTAGCLMIVALYLVLILLHVAYKVFFVGRFGATPGKMVLKLKVVMADGSRVTYGRALTRFFAEIVSALTLYIGYIMAAFDEEKRALHDRICNTRVVRV